MNWFLYIGGGIITMLIFASISTLFISNEGDKERVKFVTTMMLSWILVWIWICWKFIK